MKKISTKILRILCFLFKNSDPEIEVQKNYKDRVINRYTPKKTKKYNLPLF